MTVNDTDAEIRKVCSILESIANSYSPESDAYLAIRDAASAYILVQQRKGLKEAYGKMLLAADGRHTEEMKADLRRHGIEPDDFDDTEKYP